MNQAAELVDEPTEQRAGEFVSFPDSPFQLFQPYPPAGDQPTAINQLVEGIQDGLSYQTLARASPGSGKTYTMANVIARHRPPGAWCLAPNKTLAAQLYSEMREFFPNNAVEYFVSYYDYYQPEAYVPQPRPVHREGQRPSTSTSSRCGCRRPSRLLERRDVVSSSPPCQWRSTASAIPADYHAMVMTLRVKRQDGPAATRSCSGWWRMQYKRNETGLRPRHLPRARRHTSTCSRPNTAELAAALSSCSTTRSSRSSCSTPSRGAVRQKIPRFTVYPSSAIT